MDKKQENLETYNKNAIGMAKKFDNLPGYPEEIKKSFSYFSKENPKVLEVGCGSGRDAKEILKYTNDYLGIDFSKGLIEKAKKTVPEANFLVADLETFEFPKDLDIIFAFASLLHSNKENLKKFFDKAYESLSVGGIIFVSLKFEEEYAEKIKTDEFGKRTFYFYNIPLVKEIAGEKYKTLFEENLDLRGQKWISLMFQK